MEVPPRLARLVLVTPAGGVLGALPPCPVATPWWQEIAPVVRAAREHFDLDVVVLRLLSADQARPHGGTVTYLAEVDGPVPALEPWTTPLDEQPLRMPWARPGGPDADLAWADGVLHGLGRRRNGRPEQIRSWNLSSLWRLPLDAGTAWLKVVPPFFAHEGALIERLAERSPEAPVPALLGRDGQRVLLGEIPGQDLYDADEALLRRMVEILVALQAAWRPRLDELLSLGLPDWRAPALAQSIAGTVERTAAELSGDDLETLDRFVAELEGRLAAVAEAGLPDTLVHGDFHPGNFRGDHDRIVLLDWGDSGVGHPLLDEPAFLTRIPGELVEPMRAHWHAAWRTVVPGSDPERAAALLAPVAAARLAVIFRGFLDRLEPSERPYHADDPAEWLARAAELVRAES